MTQRDEPSRPVTDRTRFDDPLRIEYIGQPSSFRVPRKKHRIMRRETEVKFSF